MRNGVIILCTITGFLAGCSSSNQPQSGGTYQGREETKTLEAASAAGYDGTAIRKYVDNTLDKNDDHNQELDKAVKSGIEGQQKQ